MKNILVRSEQGKPRIYLIDFDKARIYPGEAPLPVVRANLNRLARSVRKLDPQGQYLSETDWQELVRFYWQVRSEEVRPEVGADGVAEVDWASGLAAGAETIRCPLREFPGFSRFGEEAFRNRNFGNVLRQNKV